MIVDATVKCPECNTQWTEPGYELDFIGEHDRVTEAVKVELQLFCPSCQKWVGERL